MQYLHQSGVEFNEIIISDDTLNDTIKSSDIIESALNSAQPDLLIVAATISQFSFLTDTQFVNLLYQFKCPVIVARHFSIPGVHKLKSFIVKVLKLSS
jgi:basic amino acid/polyamine antiporter, APA family